MKYSRAPRLVLLLGGLAVGALAVPSGLGMLLRTLVVSKTQPAEPISQFLLTGREIRKAVRLEPSGEVAPIAGYAAPPWLNFVVTDRAGRVVVSTMTGLLPGTKVGLAEVAAADTRPPGERGLTVEPFIVRGRLVGTYFALLPAYTLSRLDPVEPLLAIAVLATLLFIGGAIVAGVLAREVVRLERAAGRIAGGDLETSVQARGAKEIVDLAAAMDRMRASLKEDLARRARFLAAVSHDLRTPITAVGGYLEAVEDGLARNPETLKRYVAIMRDKTRVLEGRIAGLIEFARVETEEWRMSFAPLRLAVFLATVAREFGDDAAVLGKSFSADLDAVGELEVAADRALLSRAFENILSNALRYTPPGGLIRLAARRDEALLRIDFDDSGPGVPPGERELIFEPFSRGSAARESQGSGLGLYIARSIIRGHDWELVAGEAPGGGGRFTVEISTGVR